MPKSYPPTTRFISLCGVVLLLTACESEATKRQSELVAQLRADNARLRDSAARAPKPAPIQRPCTGERPYKNWSNTEISTALVRYTGTDNPALIDLIEEAGCRQP